MKYPMKGVQSVLYQFCLLRNLARHRRLLACCYTCPGLGTSSDGDVSLCQCKDDDDVEDENIGDGWTGMC